MNRLTVGVVSTTLVAAALNVLLPMVGLFYL